MRLRLARRRCRRRLQLAAAQRQDRYESVMRHRVLGPRLLIIDGLLDAFSDADAISLGSEVTARRQPWTLILVTGRESLAAMCDQRIALGSSPDRRT